MRLNPPTHPAERYRAQVAAWQIDRLAATSMAEQLRARGHATKVVDRSLPTDLFYRRSQFTADVGVLNLEALTRIAREADVATLVVIKRVAPDERGPHQAFFEGVYGVYYRQLFGIRRSSVYALIGVDVVDVMHAKLVERHRVAAWNGWADQLPPWTPRFEDFSPEDRASLRHRIEDHLVGQLKTIVSEIQL